MVIGLALLVIRWLGNGGVYADKIEVEVEIELTERTMMLLLAGYLELLLDATSRVCNPNEVTLQK